MPNTPNQTLSTPNKRPSIYAKQKACTQSTKYAKKHQVRQAKRKVRQKTPNTAKNTNYAKIFIYADLLRKKPNMPKKTPSTSSKTQSTPKNTKYVKKQQLRQNFHLRWFVAKFFFLPILRDFWCTFYRPKNYGGVPKKTNMRYATYPHSKKNKQNFPPKMTDLKDLWDI